MDFRKVPKFRDTILRNTWIRFQGTLVLGKYAKIRKAEIRKAQNRNIALGKYTKLRNLGTFF